MGWLDSIGNWGAGSWLSVIGGGLSAYGAIRGGQDASSYYSQLADIQQQNAAIQRTNAGIDRANADLTISEKAARAQWGIDAAQIDLENATAQTGFKTIVAQNEAAFNAYMAALTRRQAAEYADIAMGEKIGQEKIIAGETGVIEDTAALRKQTAQQAYDEKMDLVRHQVAETAARGGKGGFKINAGSFMSALRDTTSMGDLSATGTRESAFKAADINREAALLGTEKDLLNVDTSYRKAMQTAEGMEGTAQRYDLGGKINLEEIKLANALWGGAAKQYGVSKDQYDFIMGQIPTMRGLNEQRYGSAMSQADIAAQQAGITAQQGRNAQQGSYWGAAGSLISGFARAYYGRG